MSRRNSLNTSKASPLSSGSRSSGLRYTVGSFGSRTSRKVATPVTNVRRSQINHRRTHSEQPSGLPLNLNIIEDAIESKEKEDNLNYTIDWLKDNKLTSLHKKFLQSNIEINAVLDYSKEELKKFIKDMKMQPIQGQRFLKSVINSQNELNSANILNMNELTLNREDNKYSQLDKCLKDILLYKTQLKNNISHLINCHKLTLNNINDYFNDLNKLLNKTKNSFIQKTNKIKEDKLQLLNYNLKELNNYINEISNIKSNNTFKNISDDEKINIITQYEDNLELSIETGNQNGSDSVHLVLNKNNNISNIFKNNIGSINTISPPTPPKLHINKHFITSTSICLKWGYNRHNNKKYKCNEYTIAYTQNNNNDMNDNNNIKWTLIENLNNINTYVIDNLKSNSNYLFKIKAKNNKSSHPVWSSYSMQIVASTKKFTKKSEDDSKLITVPELNLLKKWIKNTLDSKHSQKDNESKEDSDNINSKKSKKDISCKLLFRASKDGYTSKSFHNKCDRKGSTLIIIKSEHGNIFGGFTTKYWKSDPPPGNYEKDPYAFIFILRGKNGIVEENDKTDIYMRLLEHNNITKLRKKIDLKKNTLTIPSSYNIISNVNDYAIQNCYLNGPTFGAGHDIFIGDLCNTNMSSSSSFPDSYYKFMERNKTTFLAGTQTFIVKDYEVFLITNY